MRTNDHAALARVSLLLAVALAGCGADTSPTVHAEAHALGARPDLQVERAGLLAADRAYAAAAAGQSVIDGVSAAMADDVYLLAGGRPLAHGRDAARAALAANPLNATASQTWRPARVDVSGDGTRGYTYGYSTVTVPPADGAPQRLLPGKYLSYWKKVGGAWRVAAHVRNGRPAGDVSEAPPPGFESPSYRSYPRFAPIGVPAGVAVLKSADFLFSGAAYLFGIGEAFAYFAAPDGAILGGTPAIIYGPAAIKAVFAGTPDTVKLTWQPLVGDVAESQDLGFTIGQSQIRDVTETDPPGLGKYLTIWKRQRGGDWRYVIDGGNSSPAP